jgi:protoporphyrin/coproporphyrin ferrochelatase
MSTGVVLMTYGAPRTRDEVAPYLSRIRGGRPVDDALAAEMTRRYETIGWSPIVERTVAQAAALERELGAGWRVAAGMRYSAPSVRDAVAALGAVDRVVGIVMSPQWSDAIMGGYERALTEAAEGRAVNVARAWHRDPAFTGAVAARVSAALGAAPARTAVVLTAHSLPRRVFDAEPDYVAQLRETGDLVASRSGLAPGTWWWAYQSAGHSQEEWLRPDLKDLFPELAAQGYRNVLVVPVQFLADHLEVLYDLDVAAAAEAAASGLRYRRVEMLNADPGLIRALASTARAAVPVTTPV